MSVIQSQSNRKTGKDDFWAEGVVEYVKLDELPEDQRVSYIKKAGQADKPVNSTHKASLLLKVKGASKDDKGVWVGLGKVKLNAPHNNLQVKVGDVWTTIEKGVEITIDVETYENNGNTYYNGRLSKVTVVSTEGVVSKTQSNNTSNNASQGGGKTFKKKDNTGVEIGQAVNGGLYITRKYPSKDLVDVSKVVHEVTVELKSEITNKLGLGEDDYDTGAMVGHAVLNACRDFKGEDNLRDFLKTYATNLIDNEVKAVTEFVRGSKTVKTDTKPQQEKVKEKPPIKSEVVKETSRVNTPPLDFDDEVPF